MGLNFSTIFPFITLADLRRVKMHCQIDNFRKI